MLASDERREAVGVSTAGTRLNDLCGYIACAEPQQRHAFDAESGDDYLTGLAVCYRQIILTDNLHDDQFGMNVAAASMFALAERSGHLGG